MRAALFLSLTLLAAPALADVRAGVEAWQRGDYRKAVDEWRDLAVGGDADAQYNMGQAYKLGRGVPVDPQMAESWFGKAARQGHEQAEDNYALALFQGGRRAEALPWLAKSTARDEPRTELVLGTMLFNGDGVPRDYVRAYALMTRAAAPRDGSEGLQSARETLAQMDGYISAPERERGVAMAQQIALTASSRPAPVAGPMRVTEAGPRTEPMQTTELPPAKVEQPKPSKSGKKQSAATPPTATVAVDPDANGARATPLASKPVVPARAPARAIATAGAYRIQLGAFRDRANAEALWSRVRGKLPGAQASYSTAAGVTRLQATGFATRAAAQAGCAKVGGGCIVIAP